MQRKNLRFYLALLSAIVIVPALANGGEPRPPGVSRFITFAVQPVYPKSFDIAAGAQHSVWGHFSIEELKDAWHKKAVQVANGRKFKVTKLVVHDNETDFGTYLPLKSRSVSGTITLLD